jgi:nucleoside-diphosphate-sugar epimerase
MLQNQPIKINGDGQQTRDFIYVDDVVAACLKVMKVKQSEIYNIATQKEIKINYIFNKIKELSQSRVEEIHVDGLWGEQLRSALKISKAQKELNWQSKVGIEKGLEKTLNWFRENL